MDVKCRTDLSTDLKGTLLNHVNTFEYTKDVSDQRMSWNVYQLYAVQKNSTYAHKNKQTD